MANDINKWIGTGRLTRSPELKSTSGGQYFCRFSIASNYSVKSGDSWTEKPNFIDCIVWGKRAETVHKYLQKGSAVIIEGELRWSSWESTDGKKNSKIEVQVHDFKFMGAKPDGAQPEPTGQGAAHFDHGGGDLDSIPF